MRIHFKAFFEGLETYCAVRSEQVQKPGLIRYLAGDNETDHFLKQTEIIRQLRFGHHRALLHLKLDEVDYLATVGFDFHPLLVDLQEVDMNSGLLVLIVTETDVQPWKPPSWVRNFVDASSKEEDSNYTGHDFDTAVELFPNIRLFECNDELDSKTTTHHFLTICTNECERGGSWWDSAFAAELQALCDAGIEHMPYDAIALSAFDSDPRTMYMALYRCLEATYAFEACRKLAKALNVAINWRDLAIALDNELSWRPKEASSLKLVLRYANVTDLEAICASANRVPGDDPTATAAKVIYELRNGIVHFGPSMDFVGFDDHDWNVLCAVLARIVRQVFLAAFQREDAQKISQESIET